VQDLSETSGGERHETNNDKEPEGLFEGLVLE